MSLLPRLALVDDRSTASNPGRVSVQWLRYAIHFPFWPACLGGGFVASAGWTVARPSFWPVPVVALALNLFYWLRVSLRFRFGCVNPGRVVSTAPFTLAVFTDLTTGGGEYPVIKILRHPVPPTRPRTLQPRSHSDRVFFAPWVIASDAKQSIATKKMDCFVALLLAMMVWTAPDGINVPDW